MFLVDFPAVDYSDPWNVPLAERMKALVRGGKRIAYFYEKPDNSTFRYRIYNMVQILNDRNDGISASYFFLDDLPAINEIADLADLLVICRSRYDHRINQLVTKFRNRRKRVLFDVDDFVFDTHYAHLILNTLDQDLDNPQVWDDWFAYSSRIGATLRLCDGAITTNDYLAARITAFSGAPTRVIPNFLNKEQLEISGTIFHKKKTLGFPRDEKIHLGYFSGSPSHNRDYAIMSSALEEVLESDPRVNLAVAGYIIPGPALSRFGGRVKRHPFHDFINLQRLIGHVEFNLMPLQSNVFTNCKSELKYFEAAIVGTVSIASPSFTYAKAIRDGENGYLSQAHQWANVIQRAIKNMGSYNELATTAFEDAHSKYAWFNQRESILQALGIE